jgi:anti-sigma regulatory factor (Ser/Thr protein kinase)
LDSDPENLTLVRGMLGGVAESFGFDAVLLDDLKTAVSEACNNVVLHAYGDQRGPLSISLYITPGSIEAIVRDEGNGLSYLAPPDDRGQGLGVAVIHALTNRAEFRPGPVGGTEVRMAFLGHVVAPWLLERAPVPDDGWAKGLTADAVVSLSPVALLPSVLGRLARALAARARFSLDRFSDVYLVADALGAYADDEASGARIGFGLLAGNRRLELTVGPLRSGARTRLRSGAAAGESWSPLFELADELGTESAQDGEALRVVLIG